MRNLLRCVCARACAQVAWPGLLFFASVPCPSNTGFQWASRAGSAIRRPGQAWNPRAVVYPGSPGSRPARAGLRRPNRVNLSAAPAGSLGMQAVSGAGRAPARFQPRPPLRGSEGREGARSARLGAQSLACTPRQRRGTPGPRRRGGALRGTFERFLLLRFAWSLLAAFSAKRNLWSLANRAPGKEKVDH